MFRDGVPNRKYAVQDGYDLIKKTKTIFLSADSVNINDDLDECIIEIFGNSDELENTKMEIHDNYT